MLPRMTGPLVTFLFFFLGFTPVVAISAPTAKIVSDENGFGCSELDPWKEHRLKIVVSDGNKLLAEKAICSSYGAAEVVVEKDAKGIFFFLLKYGEGRGTNARSEFLSVYKLGRNLIEHVRIPISEPASSSGKWHYGYRVSKPQSGGLVISLTLRIDGESDIPFAPSDRQRTIEVR
jgi:hypothetical protein